MLFRTGLHVPRWSKLLTTVIPRCFSRNGSFHLVSRQLLIIYLCRTSLFYASLPFTVLVCLYSFFSFSPSFPFHACIINYSTFRTLFIFIYCRFILIKLLYELTMDNVSSKTCFVVRNEFESIAWFFETYVILRAATNLW